MLKNKPALLLMLCILLLLSACGTQDDEVYENGNSTEDYEITLNYSDHDPPNGLRTEFIKEYWFPEIEKETDGKVTINEIYGGGLLEDDEALDGVRDGVADMSLIYPDNYPNRMYSYELFKLFPEGPEDFEGQYNIFKEGLEELPALNDVLKENNQKPLLITSGLPIAFGSANKLDSLSDVSGEDWRASSRWYLEAMKNINANPVSVPFDDVYMSLETGVIDGVMTNYDGFHMMNFDESAPNIILGPKLWWSAPFIHTINQDMWDKLPGDIQEDILKATESAQEEFGKVYADELEKTIKEEEEKGAEIKIADEEDMEAFTDEELFSKLRDTWAKEAKEEHGIDDADEYVDKLESIVDQANKESE